MEVVAVPLATLRSSSVSSVTSIKATLKKHSSTKEEEIIIIPPLEDVEQTLSVESSLIEVPPATPASRFSFNNILGCIHRPFPPLDDLELPYIREVGIKTAIDILSDHFSCPDYKLYRVQFWFLDVITDCLWKMQDEYYFPERYQKIVLEWVLFVFDIIADPRKNLSRKEFFQVFKETLMVAKEKVQSGCEILPKPQELFTLSLQESDEEISFPTMSIQSSKDTFYSGKSYVAVGVDENTEIFKLPKEFPQCSSSIVSIDSSSNTITEESECGCEESVDFYQPDLNTPERFLSSSSSFVSSESEDDLPPLRDSKFKWKQFLMIPDKICSDALPTLASDFSKNNSEVSSSTEIKEEWLNYIEDRKDFIQDLEKNIIINTCALSAIKEFVYDYFSETFQFNIAKLALINQFNSLTQNINTQWNVPKILKEELKIPKQKKPKKKKKQKKKKKDKKKKKPHKKTKAKKNKTKKKGKKKGSKKSKKPKKKKLTKEEKAELARQKREQERLEEERRRIEENRRMIFPLKDATDDDFFKSIFEKWVKPKAKKKKKGDKKKKKK